MISFIVPFSTIEKGGFLNLNEKKALWEENDFASIMYSTLKTIKNINNLNCCEDYAGNFGLGNVNEMSIDEIWNGEKYKKLVNDLSVSGGRWKYDYCSECPKTGQGANDVDGLIDYGFGLSEFVDVKLY